MNIHVGAWDRAQEEELLMALVLAGAPDLGAGGLMSVHATRSKVIADPEWRATHTTAVGYYRGAVRALEESFKALVLSVYEASNAASMALASTGMTLVERLGGTASLQYRNLDELFDVLNSNGYRDASCAVAWRMLALGGIHARAPHQENLWPLLRWICQTGGETDRAEVTVVVERLMVNALDDGDPCQILESLFTHRVIFGEPLRAELQQRADERLGDLFCQGTILDEALESLIRRNNDEGIA